MMNIYKKDDLGHADHGWLRTNFHFSFADYHNDNRMGFGPLRVINDDWIKAGSGFPMHPHRDMEIITYVRSGAVLHQDSLGNEGRTGAGDVQVMTAGTGIMHGERADPDGDTTLFQIWIKPRARNLPPRWDQAEFPKAPVKDTLELLVSGRDADAGKGALSINQDAAIYGGRLEKGTQLTHALKGPAYIVISEGRLRVNGQELAKGDGAEIEGETDLSIEALENGELLVIEV